MAQALLVPLLESGLVQRSAVRAAVASPASAERLAAEHGVRVSTDPGEAWAAPLVLLAVKPQQLEVAAAQAAASKGQSRPMPPPGASASPGPEPEDNVAATAAATVPATASAATPSADPSGGRTQLGAAPLLISVLAGVSLARLQRLFPGWRCVRAVPNTPCLVRQGLTGLAWGEGVSSERRRRVRELFALVGAVHELPESQLDAFLALTSSGPAFVALVAEAMADGAVAAGLPRTLAHELAHRTLAGTAALLHERQLHPAVLKDMVSSPAGTTIAGLRQLERGGLRSALLEAVLAAADRSRELG